MSSIHPLSKSNQAIPLNQASEKPQSLSQMQQLSALFKEQTYPLHQQYEASGESTIFNLPTLSSLKFEKIIIDDLT